jgi:hypothetical protein
LEVKVDDVEGLDMSDVEVSIEAAERPIAGGQWLVTAQDTVYYLRPGATKAEPATIKNADTLRTSPSWKKATP